MYSEQIFTSLECAKSIRWKKEKKKNKTTNPLLYLKNICCKEFLLEAVTFHCLLPYTSTASLQLGLKQRKQNGNRGSPSVNEWLDPCLFLTSWHRAYGRVGGEGNSPNLCVWSTTYSPSTYSPGLRCSGVEGVPWTYCSGGERPITTQWVQPAALPPSQLLKQSWKTAISPCCLC